MNGKRAKAIRRAVYGDLAHRARDYVRDGGTLLNRPGSPRALYQAAKLASGASPERSDAP